jgi:hypothetical protein
MSMPLISSSPDISHLLEKDALPDDGPRRRRVVWREEQLIGGGDITVSQDDEDDGHVSRTAPQPQAEITTTIISAADDPFLYMDFRVSWANNVATIRRGRVYYSNWSQGAAAFLPQVAVIPEDSIPLVLSEGDEDGRVWLSLPFVKNGRASIWGTDVEGAVYPEYTFLDIDGDPHVASTYWSWFDVAEFNRRRALDDAEPKFAVAATDRFNIPGGDVPVVRESDYVIAIANVGFSTGVKNLTLGSIWVPGGFDFNFT